MIFRVLRENEMCDKGLGKGIYSKTFSMDNYNTKTLGDALDNITTHVMKGNSSKTEFISCSNNLCLDLEKYASEQLDLRPYLAVIKNHDKSIIKSDFYDVIMEKLNLLEGIYSKISEGLTIDEYNELINQDEILKSIYDELRQQTDDYSKIYLNKLEHYVLYPKRWLMGTMIDIKQKDVKKLVIDASRNIYDDEVYKFFFEKHLIFNKDGFQKESYNQRESGTAKNSGELVVLNYISEKDIKILNPLQYDIIYGLCMNYSFGIGNLPNKIFEQIDIFCEDNYKIIESILTIEEINLFKNMYVERKPIYQLVTNIEDFKIIIGLKKNILSKCVELLNRTFNEKYSKGYMPIIEQTIDLYKSPVVKVENGKILRKTI